MPATRRAARAGQSRASESRAEKVEWRIDRWAWARAILEDPIILGLDGLHADDRRGGKYAPVRSSESLGEALTASSNYMDEYERNEVEYYKSSDCDDDYFEDCEEKAKEEDLDEDELAELKANPNKRADWAYERWDPQWAWELIKEECQEIWFIRHLLKKYPVKAIRFNDEWYELDDIICFCQDIFCHSPLVEADLGRDGALAGTAKPEEVAPHRFSKNCRRCPGDTSCRFDENAQPRAFITCPSCGSIEFHKDQLDGPRKRPINWPPRVQFPPRVNFDGTGYSAPPWEDEE